MRLPRTVTQLPVMHQRRRPAAVKVQRIDRAQPDQRRRELGQGHPRLVIGPAVTGDQQQPVVGHRERGAGMSSAGDIRIELSRPGREALCILAVDERHLAIDDEQRARLQQIAGRRPTELISPRDPHLLVRDLHACPHVTPGRVERQRRARLTVDLHLAERLEPRAGEEPADDGVAHARSLTPAHERRWALRPPPARETPSARSWLRTAWCPHHRPA